MIGVYPMLFKQTEKLWKKLGWVKAENIEAADVTSEITATEQSAAPKKNTLGIVGFALSFVIGFIGIVFSAIAVKRALKDGYDGKKLSVAGAAISFGWIVLFAICMIALVAFMKHTP